VVFEYANGVPLYAFCRAQLGCGNDHESLILGTKGRCDLARKRIEGETKWRYRRPKGPRRSAYDAEQEALFGAIRSGRPVNNGDYMVSASLAAVMGQVSCYTGKPLTREACLKSDFSLGPAPDACSFDMDPPVKPDPNGIYPVPTPGNG